MDLLKILWAKILTTLGDGYALKKSIRHTEEALLNFRRWCIDGHANISAVALFHRKAKEILEKMKEGKPTEIQVGQFCEIIRRVGEQVVLYYEGGKRGTDLQSLVTFVDFQKKLLGDIERELTLTSTSTTRSPHLHVVK